MLIEPNGVNVEIIKISKLIRSAFIFENKKTKLLIRLWIKEPFYVTHF